VAQEARCLPLAPRVISWQRSKSVLTRAIRRGIVEIGQDSAAPDFGRPHPPMAKKAE
jgi:hypothetical protein